MPTLLLLSTLYVYRNTHLYVFHLFAHCLSLIFIVWEFHTWILCILIKSAPCPLSCNPSLIPSTHFPPNVFISLSSDYQSSSLSTCLPNFIFNVCLFYFWMAWCILPELIIAVSGPFSVHCVRVQWSVHVPQQLSQVWPIDQSGDLLMIWR